MRHFILTSVAGLATALGGAAAQEVSPVEDLIGKHMTAEAMLTAHFIAAARQAGMSADAIDATLARIAEATVIDEFWVSDENGEIAFTSVPGTDFAFPTDPDAETQAAVFAPLLEGDVQVVVQQVQPRTLDDKPFKYVGVAGVDQRRIVQVGVAAGHVEAK